MAFLEQRGLRRVDLGEIYLACREHGLAELEDDGRWVPRGWLSTAQPVSAGDPSEIALQGPAEAKAHSREESSAAHLSGQQRMELKVLRAAVVPPMPEVRRASRGDRPSPEWTQFVDEAVEALGEELAAVARRRTLHDVPLRRGTVRERGVNRQVVRYEADSEPTAKDGMEARLLLESGECTVEVISTYGVMVTLSVPLEAHVTSQARLRCDLSYLLDFQAQRLRELRAPNEDFDVDAALKLLRPDASQIDVAEPYWMDGLNEQQSQAVGQALTEGTTWIWGPPGTGKTTTLAALLSDLYLAGRRVWLTAPTNMAVDIALSAALGAIKDYEVGSIARLGQPALGSLRGLQTPVLVNELVDLRSAPLKESQVGASEDLERLRERLKTLSRTAGDGAELRALELQIAEHRAYLREIEHIRAEARRAVVANARFVAATAQQGLLAALRGLTFDVVVIDEASMLPASLAALAAGAGHGHTVVAGDFRQLPPVVVSKEPKARRWLGRSAFEAAGIDQKVLQGEAPGNLVALRLQHRMPRVLADAVSAGFYKENPLETAPSVDARLEAAQPNGLAPIVCVDTSALRTRVARRGGLHSRYNLMHALLIAGLLDAEDVVGPAPALISPFSPQARLLEALVGEDAEEGEASTVHRFQGGERDVVVFDAVEAAGGGLDLHRWFDEGDDGATGARLVNVAASRARKRLILVADFNRVHRGRRRDDALSRFFRAAQIDADFVAPHDVLPANLMMRQADLDVLVSDIEAASAHIEIWSKVIDREVVLALTRPLLDAAGRGVAVTLWFEPDGGKALPDALAGMIKSDVLLRPCSPVRESSAVVDDVIWAASGPMLTSTAGHALRRTHSSLAEAVLRTTKRREVGGSAPTGDPAGECGRCGQLLVRLEGYRPMAACPRCERPNRSTKSDARHR